MSKSETDELAQQQLDAEVLQDLQTIKRELKKLSKNQLITVVFQQMNFGMEQKTANELLLSRVDELRNEISTLKGENNEEDS